MLAAWQYLEVFLIAVVVALMQLGSLSQVMVKEHCQHIADLLQALLDLGLIEDQHNDCFYLDATIESGCLVLLSGAVILNLAQQFVVRAARAAVEDREMASRGYTMLPHVTMFICLVRPLACLFMEEGRGAHKGEGSGQSRGEGRGEGRAKGKGKGATVAREVAIHVELTSTSAGAHSKTRTQTCSTKRQACSTRRGASGVRR